MDDIDQQRTTPGVSALRLVPQRSGKPCAKPTLVKSPNGNSRFRRVNRMFDTEWRRVVAIHPTYVRSKDWIDQTR